MRGGLTSGVVYPPAMAELARKYRFRYIGGASAGAIAAGAAAAAEFGRRRGGNPRAFEEVAELSGEIGTVLGDLFGPCATAKAPFRLFMLALAYGKQVAAEPQAFTGWQRLVHGVRSAFRIAWTVIKAVAILSASYWAWVLLGLLPMLALAVALAFFEPALPGWVLAALWFATASLSIASSAMLVALRLKRALTQELAASNFGMCSGMHPTDHGRRHGVLPLTPWLHATYQRLAGKAPDDPLTFGDLFGEGDGAPARNDPDIRLRVMTTCLTQGRPYVIPFAQDTFWWRPDEFEQLFPQAVVDAMRRPELDAGNGYYKLPPAEQLPIVVAIRMSLSFPVLLWAVPLHAVDYTEAPNAQGERPFRRQWFSDGGICSNFPIHFFDSPWPTRPTFGITLDAGKRHGEAGAERPQQFPQRPGSGILRPFAKVDGVGAFFGSIVDTMKDWQDALQSTLPGYRERIAVVRLGEGEGGFHLDMAPEVVDRIAQRGAEAGAALLDFDFDDHRWRRHLVWIGQLQRMLDSGRERYGAAGSVEPLASGALPLRAFLESYGPHAAHYKHSAERRAAAIENLDALMQVAQAWKDVLDERPDAKGRVRAQNFPHPAVTVRQVPADALPHLVADAIDEA